MFLSEAFDPDDPTLIDRFPDYTQQTDIGDRPPTPTREIRPRKKKKYLSAIPEQGFCYDVKFKCGNVIDISICLKNILKTDVYFYK
jgi:hypothetical protein